MCPSADRCDTSRSSARGSLALLSVYTWASWLPRETATYAKSYVVTQGETLSSIAAAVYKNARLWRPIALRNGVVDPRRLVVGQRLLIPRLPFRDPQTGEVMA